MQENRTIPGQDKLMHGTISAMVVFGQLPTTESRGLASNFKASEVIDCTSLARKPV